MNPPVTPTDFDSQLVKPGDRACDYLAKGAAFDKLVAEWMHWFMNDDGSINEDGFGSWSGAGVGGGLVAPSNVAATSNIIDKITVTWSSVSTATAYQVFRGSTSDTSLMTMVADQVAGTSWDDTGPALNVVQFYSIKAVNATQTSPFSATASGKKSSTTPPPAGQLFVDYTGSEVYPIIVPAGMTLGEFQMWGPGGRGGPGPDGTFASTGGLPRASGGGGASGSYYHLTGVPVVAGEEIRLKAGAYTGTTGVEATQVNFVASGRRIFASPGGNGGIGGFGHIGIAGSPASSNGTNDFGLTAAGDSLPGLAGTDNIGGAAVNDDGQHWGKGGDGSLDDDAYPLGKLGRIRVFFS